MVEINDMALFIPQRKERSMSKKQTVNALLRSKQRAASFSSMSHQSSNDSQGDEDY